VSLWDRDSDVVEADTCAWGTEYIVLFKDGKQVAAYKRSEVAGTEELLAEARPAGETE